VQKAESSVQPKGGSRQGQAQDGSVRIKKERRYRGQDKGSKCDMFAKFYIFKIAR